MLKEIIRKLKKIPLSQLSLINRTLDLIIASNEAITPKEKKYRKGYNLSKEENRAKKSVKITVYEDVDTLLTLDAKTRGIEKGELVTAFIRTPIEIPSTRKRQLPNFSRKKTGVRLTPETIALAKSYAEANGQRRGSWISSQIEARYLKSLEA